MTPDRTFLAVAALFVAVGWIWWAYHPRTAEYGEEWRARVARYWHERGRYCHVCHGPGQAVHHRRGNGYRWAPGHEPNRGLLGVCDRCHLEKIHALDRWFERPRKRDAWNLPRHMLPPPTRLRLCTELVVLAFVPVRVVRRRPT